VCVCVCVCVCACVCVCVCVYVHVCVCVSVREGVYEIPRILLSEIFFFAVPGTGHPGLCCE